MAELNAGLGDLGRAGGASAPALGRWFGHRDGDRRRARATASSAVWPAAVTTTSAASRSGRSDGGASMSSTPSGAVEGRVRAADERDERGALRRGGDLPPGVLKAPPPVVTRMRSTAGRTRAAAGPSTAAVAGVAQATSSRTSRSRSSAGAGRPRPGRGGRRAASAPRGRGHRVAVEQDARPRGPVRRPRRCRRPSGAACAVGQQVDFAPAALRPAAIAELRARWPRPAGPAVGDDARLTPCPRVRISSSSTSTFSALPTRARGAWERCRSRAA